jgi:uncharacterized protein (TIGR02594 family)
MNKEQVEQIRKAATEILKITDDTGTEKSIYQELFETAQKEIGVEEYVGDKHNPRVLEYHKCTTLGAKDDETSWCSSFVCWVVEQCGLKSTNSAMARSWLNWGKSLENPVKGCIVVFSRPPNPAHGHVAFYSHEDLTHVYVLGGNQSNEVCVQGYSKSRVLAFRGVI